MITIKPDGLDEEHQLRLYNSHNLHPLRITWGVLKSPHVFFTYSDYTRRSLNKTKQFGLNVYEVVND